MPKDIINVTRDGIDHDGNETGGMVVIHAQSGHDRLTAVVVPPSAGNPLGSLTDANLVCDVDSRRPYAIADQPGQPNRVAQAADSVLRLPQTLLSNFSGDLRHQVMEVDAGQNPISGLCNANVPRPQTQPTSDHPSHRTTPPRTR